MLLVNHPTGGFLSGDPEFPHFPAEHPQIKCLETKRVSGASHGGGRLWTSSVDLLFSGYFCRHLLLEDLLLGLPTATGGFGSAAGRAEEQLELKGFGKEDSFSMATGLLFLGLLLTVLLDKARRYRYRYLAEKKERRQA